MGQILTSDNIPSVIKASTTTLTLAATNNGQPTRVTVGGQQYTGAALTLNTATTGANALDTGALGNTQLWYVYLIVNQASSALALIASQTGPSAGPLMPSGYGTSYKFVGAFYTNGPSVIGSIVAIQGTAVTDYVQYTPTFTSFTVSTQTFFWSRIGSFMKIVGGLKLNSAVSGNMKVSIPAAFSIDTARLPGFDGGGGAITGSTGLGVAFAFLGGTGNQFISRIYQDSTSASTMIFNTVGGNTTWTNSIPGTWASGDDIRGFEVMVPILGWTPTLL